MLQNYSVAVQPADNRYNHSVSVPDVPSCYATGDTLIEALANAKGAIQEHLADLASRGELPPVATSPESHFNNPKYQGFWFGVIEIDTSPFMGRSSKINVSLPDHLTQQIDAAVRDNSEYQGRSHFLQRAAQKLLGAG